MTTIEILSLETVTGGAGKGFVDPRLGLSQVKLLEATPHDIAVAKVYAGVKLPSRALIRQVRQTAF